MFFDDFDLMITPRKSSITRSFWLRLRVKPQSQLTKKNKKFFKNLLTFSRACVIIKILKEGIQCHPTKYAPNLEGADK